LMTIISTMKSNLRLVTKVRKFENINQINIKHNIWYMLAKGSKPNNYENNQMASSEL
jgi:hypothetical protein